jgi:hypothetical protein
LEERVRKPVWFSVEEGRSEATLENRGFPRAIGARKIQPTKNLKNNQKIKTPIWGFYLAYFMLRFFHTGD